MARPALSMVFLTVALAVAPACATGGARRSETPMAETRVKDSAPERSAALRAADPSLHLEQEEQRWGIEQAKERQRRAAEARARQRGTQGPTDGAAGTRGGVVPCEGTRC